MRSFNFLVLVSLLSKMSAHDSWINKWNLVSHCFSHNFTIDKNTPRRLTAGVLCLSMKRIITIRQNSCHSEKARGNLFHLHSVLALRRLVMSFICVLLCSEFRLSENYIFIWMAKTMTIHPESTHFALYFSQFSARYLRTLWANNRILERFMCHSHMRPRNKTF